MHSDLTEFQKNVLAETVVQTQRNLDREPEIGTTFNLKIQYHRHSFGALTPVVAQKFTARSMTAVRQALHQLKNRGLVEAYCPYYGSTIRWFPTSLIPR